jgi:FkbH-like protein
MIAKLNAALRDMADEAGVDLVALDDRVAIDGLDFWHDPALWHRSKQEVKPNAAPLYGDLVGRLLAARQGLAAKCLVLDLDNTLWGGVIGDDGMTGIVLGQGSPLGEAFVAVQEYARDLSRRGIILAVSSKNDEANALEPFDSHPDMVLRRTDIASFHANWNDKAANIRAIAEDLNIGLDSLVFLDDNPFERTLVRQELPMVAVPEVDEDPATVVRTLMDAGYFEGVAITGDDRSRTAQYQGNKAREMLQSSATDLEGYLRSLDMRLIWSRFDGVGRQRITQLINKSNQFNLTTRRYTEEEVTAVEHDPCAMGLQLRLLDRFGDNGMISVIVGRLQDDGDMLIDTWLMSCRVLGRQVEQGTLNVVAAEAAAMGAKRLIGEYIPTKKNAMVRDHYVKLGFQLEETKDDGRSRASLDLASFTPADTFLVIERA